MYLPFSANLLFALTLIFAFNLSAAPKRIATLAPHLTEWTYSLGEGDKIVAVSAYSDYPEEAKKLPIIADVNGINLSKLIELEPDLVLVWQSNAKLGQIEKMKSLGLNVFVSDPHKLEDIQSEVNALGKLLNAENIAKKYTETFNTELNLLEQRYAKKQFKPAFFQLWHTPLMTANSNTMINQILNICGLENIFADAEVNYPTVTKEQVMLKKPEFIIVSEMKDKPLQITHWQNLTHIPAVKKNQFIALNPDYLHRYTNRVLFAANELCQKVHSLENKTL